MVTFRFCERMFPRLYFHLYSLLRSAYGEHLQRLKLGCCAGVAFSVLVFSYFYLWTALLAWFAAILILWVVLEDRKRALKVSASHLSFPSGDVPSHG